MSFTWATSPLSVGSCLHLLYIAISYSCIAPIILGFAGIGFYVVYLVYRYNLIFVFESEIDTRGLVYPRALMQTLVGIYLAEICLIGLFCIRAALGPLLLMALFLIFTGLVHISLNEALNPLLYNLPKTLAVEEQDDQLANGRTQMKQTMIVNDLERSESQFSSEGTLFPEDAEENSREIEGAPGALHFVSDFLKSHLKSKLESNTKVTALTKRLDFWSQWISPDPAIKPNFLLKWLHPEIYADYSVLRETVPRDLPDPTYPGDSARNAYYPPAVVAPTPTLWIPRDPAGVTQQELAHTGKVIPITDEGAELDENNCLVVDLGILRHPVPMERIRY